jgi:MSHA biogenesis protein MshP
MRHCAHPAQLGFAAIAAVFLVVILAALGAFMVSFSNTQHLTAAQDIQGSRAYWAARAGLEWAIASTGPAACGATTPTPPVDGFTLTITCSATPYTDGGVTLTVFQFTSVASSGTAGTPGRVERNVSASLEK